MSVLPPSQFNPGLGNSVLDALDQEIASEKASSLRHAGRRVEAAMAAWRAGAEEAPERERLLRQAADAVYAYFVQRELCGMRRQEDVIREYGIPRQVLVRLGAR